MTSFLRRIIATFAIAYSTPLIAEAPKVVTDIAPIQSLAAIVMDGIAAPFVIVDGTASPHGFTLRPSQAKALQEADLVIWTADDLTPWLADKAPALAPNAETLTLMDVAGTTQLPAREGAIFDDHAHDHDHDHHGSDPHGWLDPDNARRWLDAIASAVSALDPENAATYKANAAAGTKALSDLEVKASTRLETLGAPAFIVFHDSFQYFENRFNLHAKAAVALGDASEPGAAHLSELRDLILANQVDCLFIEPQLNPAMAHAISDGMDVKLLPIDPLGSGLVSGRNLYPQLIESLIKVFEDCAN